MQDIPDILPLFFQKNAQEAIGVSITEWKGHKRVDIRTYIQPLGEDELVATKKGIVLPLELFSRLVDGVRELGNVMGPEKIVSRISKSSKEEIRIGTTHFRGNQLIYIRSYVLAEDEEPAWIPTKKGVSMRADLYPKLLDVLEELDDMIE